MAITQDVPQGSILGVLKLNLPGGVKIVGFADDVALLVIGESREKV